MVVLCTVYILFNTTLFYYIHEIETELRFYHLLFQKHIKTTVEQYAPELIKPSSSKPVITNGWEKSPPVIPPRNGSKLEHSASPKPKIIEKYFDSNIEAEPSPPGARKELNIGDEGKVDVTDKAGGGGGGGYRENWKARQEKQNTLVFNFTNTKKDVSHIENDGLDLTNRTSKKVNYKSKFNK